MLGMCQNTDLCPFHKAWLSSPYASYPPPTVQYSTESNYPLTTIITAQFPTMTSISDLKPTKTCHLCSKHIDGHLFGSDFTCRSCQHECRRVEPLFRTFATLLTSLQREYVQSIKGVKEELAELKNMLSSRQQKANNTLKGLKDEISHIKTEVDVLKLVKTKGADGEGLKKVTKELEEVKKEVKGLD